MTKTVVASSAGSLGNAETGQLRAFIERIEQLTEEKKDLSNDIKHVYAEVKGEGFDTKILRRLIKLRAEDADKRREEAEILDLYCSALGLF